MPNQVTERALRALARASEVVIHSRRRCQLVDRGSDGGGGIWAGRVTERALKALASASEVAGKSEATND